jgi:peptidoglycan/xylan/chitin deacetylase (PgdA/CDA1 family)
MRWPVVLLVGMACSDRDPVTTAAYQKTLAPPPAPLPKVIGEVVAHGPRTSRTVALTFDACSTRDVSRYDARITRELIAANAPATIFLGGSWAREEPEHVKELAANPLFELENHSYSHPHMTKVSAARVRQELLHTQAEVMFLTGRQPLLFRPPYGEYDEKLVKAAADVGLTTIEYDLASGDPDQHATKERLIEWVLAQARPGSIIVMHINHVRFHTAEALPGIIAGLRAKGFTLVKVSDLIGEAHDDRELVAEAEADAGR